MRDLIISDRYKSYFGNKGMSLLAGKRRTVIYGFLSVPLIHYSLIYVGAYIQEVQSHKDN